MTTRITTDNITDGQVKTADLADTEVTNENWHQLPLHQVRWHL